MAKKILIVDDDRYIVEIYRRALAQERYEVTCAYDGKEGLDTLKTNPQVDLIVLDLKMPKMTGDEFLKVLRKEPTLKDIKVLVISSFLYRYKKKPGYEDLAGQFGEHSYMDQNGLTKIGKKAEDGQPTDMQEKTKQRLEPVGFGTFEMQPEKQGEFEQSVSEDLIKRVKAIFGEPYEEKKREIGLMPPKPKTLIPERVIELIAECLKVDKERLSTVTNFDKDLGVCYISQLRLRRRINKEFSIKVSFLNHREIETIGDLINVVEYTKERSVAYERKRLNKEFFKEWEPFVYIWIIFTLIGLVMLLWEFVIKKYFLKSP